MVAPSKAVYIPSVPMSEGGIVVDIGKYIAAIVAADMAVVM